VGSWHINIKTSSCMGRDVWQWLWLERNDVTITGVINTNWPTNSTGVSDNKNLFRYLRCWSVLNTSLLYVLSEMRVKITKLFVSGRLRSKLIKKRRSGWSSLQRLWVSAPWRIQDFFFFVSGVEIVNYLIS